MNYSYLQLMRPRQYIKNLFIVIPLFFSYQITDLPLLINTLLAFVAFSLSASAVYILNDFYDIEADRSHPSKKNRPLASGVVSKKNALILMLCLLVSGTVLMAFVSWPPLIIMLFYVLLNIAYTRYLKHIAIIDISVIAIGFVMRLFIGAFVAMVDLSMWIVVMTFLLALFLALAKRRDDILIYIETGHRMRKVVDGYNLQFLDAAMMIMASVILVAYIMFTTSIEITQKFHSDYLYITAFFVILGMLRYLQITFVEKTSGNPTQIVFEDRFIQLTLAGWLLSYIWILYLS